MKIGIDARLINETGVGRYIRNLIDELSEIDSSNKYIIYLNKKGLESFTPPNDNFETRLANVKWHTVSEQFILPAIFSRDQLDLLHIPYFTIPLFYPGPMVVTMHDLTVLHIDTGKASTLHPFIYKLKKLAYYIVLSVGLRKARKVISVSEFTKDQLVKFMHLSSEKIDVTYEGFERNQKCMSNTLKTTIPNKFYLYVGNAYPHKNIDTMILGYQKYITTHRNERDTTSLVLVGPDDIFYEHYKKYVHEHKLTGHIFFYGPASYEELHMMYQQATALIFPSIMEGFGLPGIEAMSEGLPVIASDIAVFREIYSNHAQYFDVSNPDSLAQVMDQVDREKRSMRTQRIENAKKYVQKFSWRKMAKQTLEIYSSCGLRSWGWGR